MSLPAGRTFRADAGSRPVRARAWWRRHRFWLLCGALFVAVTVAGYAVTALGPRTGGALSVTNPAPEGGQAAAAVLGHQGVTVTATDSVAATLAALSGQGRANTTIMVYDPRTLLSPGQAGRLSAAAADSGAKVVAVAPGPLTVRELSAEISSAGSGKTKAQSVPSGCANADAAAAGSIDAGTVGGLASLAADTATFLYRGPTTCFIPAESTAAKAGPAGLMATNRAGDVTVLGNPGVVSNQGLASRGNAALVFRTLGSRPNLIWYTASLKDVPVANQPPDLAALTPEWIFPAAMWLLVVGLLGMLWRGRRNGPLVSEPLPVIVRATETVTGRARLYQDAKALDTAARTLQRAALTRLAGRLRLGAAAPPEAVVEAAAAHSGRSRPQLHRLLLTDTPSTEKELLFMAQELEALEEEVAHR